jgi:hypothetical protein
MIKARHFNAGINPQRFQVPQGRLKIIGLNTTTGICGKDQFGLKFDRATHPALTIHAPVHSNVF